MIPILASNNLFVITSGNDIKTREEITPPETEGCKLKMLVAIVITSGSISSHVVEQKGVEADRYSVDKLVEDTGWLGYSQITVKNDNEPAIVQVLEETLKSLKASTVDQAMKEHPAPYDSNANGSVQNAVVQVQGLMHTLKVALGRKISKAILLDHWVVSWMVERAAFSPTTRRVKNNGLTAWQHLRGLQFGQSFVYFGERCI